jgi:hypothetical protein
MIHALFKLYAATPLSSAIRQSSFDFAAIEMVHLVALALLGGVLLVATLGLCGLGFQFPDRPGAWRGLRITALWALTAAVLSGALLVGVNPMKYYFNDAFRAKMVLLASAIIISVIVDRVVLRGDVRRARLAACGALLGLLLWLGVGLAGRLIGLL